MHCQYLHWNTSCPSAAKHIAGEYSLNQVQESVAIRNLVWPLAHSINYCRNLSAHGSPWSSWNEDFNVGNIRIMYFSRWLSCRPDGLTYSRALLYLDVSCSLNRGNQATPTKDFFRFIDLHDMSFYENTIFQHDRKHQQQNQGNISKCNIPNVVLT